MEIKVSTALETALEFISEVATCKEEELQEKYNVAYFFIQSLEDEISDILLLRLNLVCKEVKLIRRIAKNYKDIGH